MPTLPKLDWQTANIDTLPPTLAKAYAAYRKTVEATNKERAAFEAAVTAHMTKHKMVPAGKEPRFAYRFGRLAIAFADPSEAKSAGAGDQFTF